MRPILLPLGQGIDYLLELRHEEAGSDLHNVFL